MKSNCESCQINLDVESNAFICSYDCTFCQSCTDKMRAICPNCGGELVPRPRRTTARSFSIVHAGLGHLEAASLLFDQYRSFYGKPSNLNGAREFLRDRIANQESILFLAVAAEGALGFTQLYPSFSSVGMARGLILNDLFVSSTARRRGVALGLVSRAQAFAKSTGAAWLKLETAVSNTQAQALYRKLGFTKDDGFEHHTLHLTE